MAKVKDLKKGLGSLRKKAIIAEEKSEEIINKVHDNRGEVKTPKKRGRRKMNTEKTVRYTIDLPESLYKELKHRIVDEGGTMKAFIMKAIKKELNNQ